MKKRNYLNVLIMNKIFRVWHKKMYIKILWKIVPSRFNFFKFAINRKLSSSQIEMISTLRMYGKWYHVFGRSPMCRTSDCRNSNCRLLDVCMYVHRHHQFPPILLEADLTLRHLILHMYIRGCVGTIHMRGLTCWRSATWDSTFWPSAKKMCTKSIHFCYHA
jgi:hypothetical protein